LAAGIGLSAPTGSTAIRKIATASKVIIKPLTTRLADLPHSKRGLWLLQIAELDKMAFWRGRLPPRRVKSSFTVFCTVITGSSVDYLWIMVSLVLLSCTPCERRTQEQRVNYHRQRRWLEMMHLEGATLLV
jgi:hypothetical protein